MEEFLTLIDSCTPNLGTKLAKHERGKDNHARRKNPVLRHDTGSSLAVSNLGEVLTVFQALQNALARAGRIDDDNPQFHKRTRVRYLRTGFRSNAYGIERANQDSKNCSPRAYKRSVHRRKRAEQACRNIYPWSESAAAQILNTIKSPAANVYHGQPGKLREH